MPRFAPWAVRDMEITGTGTSGSYILLMPKQTDRVPCVLSAELVADTNTTLDFYKDTADDFSASPALMKTYPPDGHGVVTVCEWGPGCDQPSLTNNFTDDMSFGFKVTCAAGAPYWRLKIKVGWAR